MTKLERFVEIFELPPAMIPHIDYVVTGQEMDLVVGLGKGEMTVPEIAQMMGLQQDEAEQLVISAFHRAVIKKAGAGYGHRGAPPAEGPTKYTSHNFYRRLDPLSMYEDWGDVPEDARNAVIDWQMQEFIDIWQHAIDAFREDPDSRERVPNRDFLLLDEALEIVDAAEDFVVVPCDCRTIVRACDRPVEVCVRLDLGAKMTLEHGHGRRVTKEEMKQIVVDADRAGLMHTGNRFWKESGQVFGFCNCCACDCYPIRAGIQMDLHQVWPRSYFIAERDMDKCLQCGICVKRCQFGAFYFGEDKVEIKGKMRRPVLFDPDKCWGCGLCSTGCPEESITMVPLPHTEVEKS